MPLKAPESRISSISLLLIAPFFLWGTAMVAMKGTLLHTTPLFMAGIRLVPAGLLILGVVVLTGRPQPRGWLAWLWIGLFGLVDGALFQGFLAEGLVRTGAGLGSVMIDSQPLAVAILARLLFGELVGIWGWLGLGFGVAGISLLGLPDRWITGWLHGEFPPVSLTSGMEVLQQLFQSGEWLMLMAALSMAVGTVMMRYVSQYSDPISATGWHMIVGGLPLFALSAQFESQQWTHLQFLDWTALAYSTVFGSAIAYGLFFYFAAKGNLTSLSSLTFLTPVFALLFGNLFLEEALSLVQWFGVGLTLISIYLINQRDFLSQKLSWSYRLNRKDASTRTETSGHTQSSQTSNRDITEMTAVKLNMAEPESEVSS